MPLRLTHLFRAPETAAVAAATVATLSLLAVLATALIPAREQAIRHGEKSVHDFARLYAENTRNSLNGIETLLTEMSGVLETREDWVAARGHRFLRARRTRALPQLRDLAVVGPDGLPRFHSSLESAPATSFADKDWFIALRKGTAEMQFSASQAAVERPDVPLLTRRLGGERFEGALVAWIEPSYFNRLCSAAPLYMDTFAALRTRDGTILAGCQDGAASPGKVMDEQTSHDRQVTVVVPVEGYPLEVVVSVMEGAFLDEWRALAGISAAGMAVVAGLSGTLAAALFLRGARERRLLKQARDELEGMVRDRTKALETEVAEHRLTAEGLAAAIAEAERASAAKTRFLAAASHDLRQPLHALGLYVALLLQEGSPRIEAVGRRIADTVSALEHLLKALLDVSKLDAGLIVPEPRPVRLDLLAARLADEFSVAAEAKGLRLSTHLRPALAVTDEALMETVLRNLLSNALKHTQSGFIVLACRPLAGDIALEVWDSGAGIPAEQLELIFEEFHQVGNKARDRSEGLGLGLAIVRRILAMLDHRVTVSSRLGRGSRFQVRVRPAPASAALPPPTSEPARLAAGAQARP